MVAYMGVVRISVQWEYLAPKGLNAVFPGVRGGAAPDASEA